MAGLDAATVADVTAPAPTIDVLVVDDDPVVRFGLTMMLRGAPDLRVVAEAGDGAEALVLAERHAPDVVLMDIRMPVTDGLTVTETLRGRLHAPQVVVLTTFYADAHVLRALRAGAAGFLLKDTPPDELVVAIRHAAAGRPVLSPEVTRRLIDRVAAGDHDTRRDGARRRLGLLAEREHDIARKLGAGRSNAETARGSTSAWPPSRPTSRPSSPSSTSTTGCRWRCSSTTPTSTPRAEQAHLVELLGGPRRVGTAGPGRGGGQPAVRSSTVPTNCPARSRRPARRSSTVVPGSGRNAAPARSTRMCCAQARSPHT